MADKTRYTANLVSDSNFYVDIANDRVGIGTTIPTSKLSVGGDVYVSGIITSSGAVISGATTATSFSGSGANLTGIVTSIVAGSNITISGSTGQVTIDSTASGGAAALDILEVMMFA